MQYSGTRHNVGFRVLDAAARNAGVEFRKASPLFMEATVSGGGRLIKPLTFMNRSGEALRALLEVTDVDISQILACVDDVNLQVGRLRIRGKGSHGGHNGLRDLERALGGVAYPRLRLGVGAVKESEGTLVEHVLGAFSDDEEKRLAPAVEAAARAVLEFLEGTDLETLKHRYNGMPASQGDRASERRE